MSLKSKYKTTSALAREGVWFDLDPNSDGTVPRFKMRPSNRSNPDWSPTFRAHTGDKDMETVSAEEDEVITANIFAEANIVDWENFQPEDDGVVLPFSVENAKAILTDTDWIRFLNHLQNLVAKAEPFQDFSAKLKGEAGN